jgi:hypothetical protein
MRGDGQLTGARGATAARGDAPLKSKEKKEGQGENPGGAKGGVFRLKTYPVEKLGPS